MFTGIIQAVGTLQSLQPLAGDDCRLVVQSAQLGFDDVALGDSIAVNGVCLTVIAKTDDSFTIDASAETLRCTAGLNQVDNQVNLEKAMRLSDRLGGHLVSGHVDGVGQVMEWNPIGDCMELVIQLPEALAKYTADKGSICVNGVSLTTNRAWDGKVSINLIPHTLQQTNLHALTVGAQVNIEVDQIARYVEQMLRYADGVRDR